jgi:hypothetical protein
MCSDQLRHSLPQNVHLQQPVGPNPQFQTSPPTHSLLTNAAPCTIPLHTVALNIVYGKGGTYSAIRSRSFLIVPDLVWGRPRTTGPGRGAGGVRNGHLT